MHHPTATMRITRPICIDGVPQKPGTKVELELEDALVLHELGRGEFLDDDDRAKALQARRAAIARMVKQMH